MQAPVSLFLVIQNCAKKDMKSLEKYGVQQERMKTTGDAVKK